MSYWVITLKLLCSGKGLIFFGGEECTGAENFTGCRGISKFLASGWRLSNPKLSSPYIS